MAYQYNGARSAAEDLAAEEERLARVRAANLALGPIAQKYATEEERLAARRATQARYRANNKAKIRERNRAYHAKRKEAA